MKRIALLQLAMASVLSIALLFTGSDSNGQSGPREQLNQMVTQLRSNPGDNALREKIIKLAQTIKPAPAVSEEARGHFVEGTAIAKSARSPAQQTLAVQSFQEALKVAPWWGDAYYNLAVAQELAGQFDAAQASLKLYILTNPGEKDARDAQDRIYALNAKKRLAQNSPATAADRERNFLASLEGATWRGEPHSDSSIGLYQRRDYVVRNGRLEREWMGFSGSQNGPLKFKEVDGSTQLTSRRVVYNNPRDGECNPHTVQISEDGNRISETRPCHGRTFTFEYLRASP